MPPQAAILVIQQHDGLLGIEAPVDERRPDMRLTLDTPQDLEVIRALFGALRAEWQRTHDALSLITPASFKSLSQTLALVALGRTLETAGEVATVPIKAQPAVWAKASAPSAGIVGKATV